MHAGRETMGGIVIWRKRERESERKTQAGWYEPGWMYLTIVHQ